MQLFNLLCKSFFSVHTPFSVPCLRDAVGIQDDHISYLEMGVLDTIRCIGKGAQKLAGRVERLETALLCTKEDGAIVSGVRIEHQSLRVIGKLGVEHRDELLFGKCLVDELIEPGHQEGNLRVISDSHPESSGDVQRLGGGPESLACCIPH